MININYPQQTVASSSYTNGHPAKKRRSTASSAPKPRIQSATLPTPTSATHPPADAAARSALPTFLDPKAEDTNTSSTAVPPFTPPSTTSALNGPTNTNTALNIPFSPSFSFSPLPQLASLAPSPGPANQDSAFDPMLSMPTPYEQQHTPGGASASGSAHTDPENKDPFLSLLEQLAENEMSQQGGPSELDYFLQTNT